MKHKSDGDTNCNWYARYSHQRISTRTGGYGNKRTSRDHSNSNIVDVGQNTEKNPGDLRSLAVTQSPVKNHQLTLLWKILKGVKSQGINLTSKIVIHSSKWMRQFLKNWYHSAVGLSIDDLKGCRCVFVVYEYHN